MAGDVLGDVGSLAEWCVLGRRLMSASVTAVRTLGTNAFRRSTAGTGIPARRNYIKTENALTYVEALVALLGQTGVERFLPDEIAVDIHAIQ